MASSSALELASLTAVESRLAFDVHQECELPEPQLQLPRLQQNATKGLSVVASARHQLWILSGQGCCRLHPFGLQSPQAYQPERSRFCQPHRFWFL